MTVANGIYHFDVLVQEKRSSSALALTHRLADYQLHQLYTALQKFGITWGTSGIPANQYSIWNTYYRR